MVLADAEEVDADFVGEDALFDDVPNRLGVRLRAIVLVVSPITERVETEDERNSTAPSGSPKSLRPVKLPGSRQSR